MVFPNWLKIMWWSLLLIGLGSLLFVRLPAFAAGTAVSIDIIVFVIWIALLLAPLFQEVSLFGITLKQQVHKLKDEVAGLRNDIRNSVDVRAQFNPTFNVPAPPPDSQLPALEERLRHVLPDVLRDLGVERVLPVAELQPAPDDVAFLFNARYRIERELRRLWQDFDQEDETRRPMPVFRIATALAQEGLLDDRLAHAVRDVYRVASPAVHGESVSNAKVAFVRDVAPEIVSALESIRLGNVN